MTVRTSDVDELFQVRQVRTWKDGVINIHFHGPYVSAQKAMDVAAWLSGSNTYCESVCTVQRTAAEWEDK